MLAECSAAYGRRARRFQVHVLDLCDAHLRALDWLVTGSDIQVEQAARRPGDPASLVADAAKARRILGWKQRR